jgi:hypothetical protein
MPVHQLLLQVLLHLLLLLLCRVLPTYPAFLAHLPNTLLDCAKAQCLAFMVGQGLRPHDTSIFAVPLSATHLAPAAEILLVLVPVLVLLS